MKATVNTKGKRPKKTVFGLASTGRSKQKRQMTGKLVEHICRKCNVEITYSPEDCDSVVCGTCALKAAHNFMLDTKNHKRVNLKGEKK